MRKKIRRVFTAAIVILALAEIFCEDFAVISGFPVPVRRFIRCAGFCFDIFFTAQFLVGLYTASLNRKARLFLWYKGGWLDFLAAVPLLVLHSGPAMFGLAAGGLPVSPRILRITEVLRFLRFLKLFKPDSSFTAGKTGTAFLVSALVLAGALLGPVISRPGILKNRILDNYSSAAIRLARETEDRESLRQEIREYSKTEENLLLVKQEAFPLYSRYDFSYYERYYAQADYLWMKNGKMDFYFSRKPFLIEDAWLDISWFCVLAALFSAFFIYDSVRNSATGARNSVRKGSAGKKA
jgi:hypothetical protein